MPVFVFIVIKLLQTTPWKISKPLSVFYIIILGGLIASLFPQMQLAARRAEQEQEAQVAKVQAINRLAQEKKVKEEDIVVVYAYAVPLKCAGLLEATNWTGNFQKEMSELCPNQFAIWDSEIELNTAVPVRDIEDIHWDLVIWPGNGTHLPEYLYSKGAINIPDSWHVHRAKWFFIHPIGE
jgi:type II secretory pathway pseudopilin PulG